MKGYYYNNGKARHIVYKKMKEDTVTRLVGRWVLKGWVPCTFDEEFILFTNPKHPDKTFEVVLNNWVVVYTRRKI